MLADPNAAFIDVPAPRTHSLRVVKQNEALAIYQALRSPASEPLGDLDASMMVPLLAVRQPKALCRATVEPMLLSQLHAIAERTLPHLGPGHRRELWTDARWLGCDPGQAAPAVRERLALYQAIAARDAAAMQARATELLVASGPAAGDWQRFLLSTAMLGALAQGRTQDARDLWMLSVDRLYPDRRFPAHVIVLANWGR
jgi:hypothetical protein